MTIKDLARVMENLEQQYQQRQQSEDNPALKELISKCRGLPFWRWGEPNYHMKPVDLKDIKFPQGKGSSKVNEQCCFVHTIGLPERPAGRKHIMYDYEYELFKYLEIPEYANVRKATKEDEEYIDKLRVDVESKAGYNTKESVVKAHSDYIRKRIKHLTYPQKVGRVAVAKSTSLGITHFCLLYILWKIMKDDKLRNSDVAIITGVREALSIDILQRIRNILSKHGVFFDTAKNTLHINGVRIRSYPSTINSLRDLRGQENISILYCSEAAFFPTDDNTIREITDVLERYASKSSAIIILESTVNKVGDLLYRLFHQKWEDSFYKLLKLSYEWGIGKIYSDNDVLVAKASSSFNREYALSWSSPSGTTFLSSSIDRAIELGKKYFPDLNVPIIETINKDAQHSLGIDPGFSSSDFALVCLEYSDSLVKVVYADNISHISFDQAVQKYWDVRNMVGNLTATYIDSSNPEYIHALKESIGEISDWYTIREKIQYAKKNRSKIENFMKIIPVAFSQQQEGVTMITHCQNLLDNPDGIVAINPRFENLITALRGAVSIGGRLIKEESPGNDLTDALDLLLVFSL